jgi:hypothetical protein
VVFFCPLCGVAFAEPPPPRELNEILRLDELAPAGVVIATRAQVEAAVGTEIVELHEQSKRWVEEVLWHPPAPGETDEDATKALFDRWYGPVVGHLPEQHRDFSGPADAASSWFRMVRRVRLAQKPVATLLGLAAVLFASARNAARMLPRRRR